MPGFLLVIAVALVALAYLLCHAADPFAMAEPPPSPEPAPAEGDGFRWPALFQRSVDPVFVLNRRRQIQFVNRAWEALTGLAAREVHQRICRRQRDASPASCEA